jgi:thiol-disulfide isomerase/thioredoxin
LTEAAKALVTGNAVMASFWMRQNDQKNILGCKMRYFLILTLIFLTFAHANGQKTTGSLLPDDGVVSLEKQTFPSTGRLVGISNIFFEKTSDTKLGVSKDWKDVEIANVISNPTYLAINALRFKDATGETRYVVDTDGDLDFRGEKVLVFKTSADIELADFAVHPVKQPKSGTKSVDYQIIRSKDGYVYARISEYRQGLIKIAQNSYKIMLRPGLRSSPSFDLSGNTKCLIDTNQDGEFTERWQLNAKGEVVANEEINLAGPFIIGTEKVRVANLDESGTRLKIAFTNEEISIAPGFKAPDFSLKSLNNESFDLQRLRGKIVLLEFWSVACPFCQRILPEENALLLKNKSEDFVAIAVSREGNLDEINKYLAKNPRDAKVVLNNGEIWPIYNSQITTPTYYLLDKQGVIRLSGYGAYPDIIKIIDKKIQEIRRE